MIKVIKVIKVTNSQIFNSVREKGREKGRERKEGRGRKGGRGRQGGKKERLELEVIVSCASQFEDFSCCR